MIILTILSITKIQSDSLWYVFEILPYDQRNLVRPSDATAGETREISSGKKENASIDVFSLEA